MPTNTNKEEPPPHNCIWREISIALMCVILSAIIALLIVIASQPKMKIFQLCSSVSFVSGGSAIILPRKGFQIILYQARIYNRLRGLQ